MLKQRDHNDNNVNTSYRSAGKVDRRMCGSADITSRVRARVIVKFRVRIRDRVSVRNRARDG